MVGDTDAADDGRARTPAPPYGSVVLAASDLAALRMRSLDLPELGRARMVGVVVAEARRAAPAAHAADAGRRCRTSTPAWRTGRR